VHVVTRYAPTPLLPRWRPRASHAAEQMQCSSSFPHQYVLKVSAAPASSVKAAMSKAAWCP